jgi:hypothetical protein
MAAGAEEYGDVQPAVIDPGCPLQDFQIHGLDSFFNHRHGFFGLQGFILIIGRLFEGVCHFYGAGTLHCISLDKGASLVKK